MREAIAFIGGRGAVYLGLGLAVGFLLSATELGLAYALQAFLGAIGLRSAEAVGGWMATLQTSLHDALALLMAVGAARALMTWAQTFLMMAAPEHFKHLQRLRIATWLFASRSPSASHVTSLAGETVNQASTAVMRLQSVLGQGALIVTLAASLLWISPALTLVALVSGPVLALPLVFLSRRFRAAGHGLIHEWENANSRLLRGARNLLLLRIHGMEEREAQGVRSAFEGYFSHAMMNARLNGALAALPQMLGIGLVCLIAAWGREVAGIAAGALLAYCYLFVRFVQNVIGLNVAVSSLLYSWPQLVAVRDWWKTNRGAIAKAGAGGSARPPRLDAPVGWRIENASFRYGAASVLARLDLEVPAGSCLVVTGPSGSGKTTLLHLLLGELQPESGDVSLVVGGKPAPLSSLKSSLVESSGYVGPDSFVFDGTLREILGYGLDRLPPPDELERCLDAADCGFVRAFPQGLDHRLTDQGQGLSAGQKQRLALARALMRKPRVLILDEATANLDPESAENLVTTLSRLKGTTTIVAATHRPELVRIADAKLELKGSPA